MKLRFIVCALIFLLPTASFAQKDTMALTPEQTRNILKQIKVDTVKLLKHVSEDACKCIDSLSLGKKDAKEISADIAACIDKEVIIYQSIIMTDRAMKEGNLNIIINTNKESDQYQNFYFLIEEWLADSCASIKIASAVNNKESELSISKNKKAQDEYNSGIAAMNEEDYNRALPWFEKAVKTDPKFAFAWDNIGICNRKLGNLESALIAYNKSLELDPKGRTPLHNIPVVYEYKKEYDKALEAYKKLAEIYPDDPEAYYGAGRMYEFKNDFEKAVDYMCKAYNAYVTLNSPYRVDAQNNIKFYYSKLKELGKEDVFFKILKDNNIRTQ